MSFFNLFGDEEGWRCHQIRNSGYYNIRKYKINSIEHCIEYEQTVKYKQCKGKKKVK